MIFKQVGSVDAVVYENTSKRPIRITATALPTVGNARVGYVSVSTDGGTAGDHFLLTAPSAGVPQSVEVELLPGQTLHGSLMQAAIYD